MEQCIILWVEDDDDQFLLFRRACRSLSGLSIRRERDGAGALNTLEASGVQPDLIVSDLNMPSMTGLGLLEWIRSHETTGETPFILFTDSDNGRNRDESIRLRATEYCLKPADINLVTSLVVHWVRLASDSTAALTKASVRLSTELAELIQESATLRQECAANRWRTKCARYAARAACAGALRNFQQLMQNDTTRLSSSTYIRFLESMNTLSAQRSIADRAVR